MHKKTAKYLTFNYAIVFIFLNLANKDLSEFIIFKNLKEKKKSKKTSRKKTDKIFIK